MLTDRICRLEYSWIFTGFIVPRSAAGCAAQVRCSDPTQTYPADARSLTNTIWLTCLPRLLRSEPADAYRGLQDKVNTSTHGHVVDILQVLASRGALDQSRLKELEVVLIERIITSVYNGTVDRQNKMLHVLHTVIHALVSGETRSEQSMRRQPTWMSTPDTISGREDSSAAPAQTGSTPNPLLLRMIVVGLSTRTNRPVLQHWVDFVLMMAPYYRRSLAALLLPINDCICGLLRSGMSEIERVYAPGTPDQGQASTANTSCETTDAEVMMLINASERVLLLCLDESSLQTTVEDDLYTVPERGPDSATGLLGYVSNVFAPDASSSTSATPAVCGSNPKGLSSRIADLALLA